jgi:hypothetical protein
MSIEYLSDGKKFLMSYQELKEHHYRISCMTDEGFLNNLTDALHLACFICYLKEIPTYVCLTDTGIIHELVHLSISPDTAVNQLHDIREMFNKLLELK